MRPHSSTTLYDIYNEYVNSIEPMAYGLNDTFVNDKLAKNRGFLTIRCLQPTLFDCTRVYIGDGSYREAT